MALTPSANDLAFRDLQSRECVCGSEKQPQRTFCLECYKALPANMQRALYKRIGSGYAEAYDEAKTYLHVEADRY